MVIPVNTAFQLGFEGRRMRRALKSTPQGRIMGLHPAEEEEGLDKRLHTAAGAQIAAREEAPPLGQFLGQFAFVLTCLSGGAHSAGSTPAEAGEHPTALWEEIALDQSGLCFLPVVIHLPTLSAHPPNLPPKKGCCWLLACPEFHFT